MKGNEMEEAEFVEWRKRIRTTIFETLVIQNAFLMQMSLGQTSVDQAEQAILEGLDGLTQRSDALWGAMLKDPALTGLYSDEVKGVIDQIKELVRFLGAHYRTVEMNLRK
jgi:hypothetical protein